MPQKSWKLPTNSVSVCCNRRENYNNKKGGLGTLSGLLQAFEKACAILLIWVQYRLSDFTAIHQPPKKSDTQNYILKKLPPFLSLPNPAAEIIKKTAAGIYGITPFGCRSRFLYCKLQR